MKKFSVLILLFCSIHFLSADEENLISIEFKTYSLGKADSEVYYHDGVDYQNVFIPNNKRSMLYPYKGKRNFEFYRKINTADGQIRYKSIANVKLAKESKAVFFIFFPAGIENGKTVYKVYSVEDTFHSSKADNWMVLNLTGRDLITRIESDVKPFILNPGKTNFVKPTPNPSKAYTFTVGENHEGSLRLLYNATWPHYNGKRAIVFLMPRGQNSQGIRVKHFYELVQLPKPVEVVE